MTSIDTSPSIGSFLVMKIGRKLNARKESRALPRTWVQGIVRNVLILAGFSCLTQAAFTWSTLAGWAAAGLSCLAVSTLLTTSGGADVRSNPNPGNHIDNPVRR